MSLGLEGKVTEFETSSSIFVDRRSKKPRGGPFGPPPRRIGLITVFRIQSVSDWFRIHRLRKNGLGFWIHDIYIYFWIKQNLKLNIKIKDLFNSVYHLRIRVFRPDPDLDTDPVKTTVSETNPNKSV